VAWFDLSIQPVPEGLFILSHDITQRKRSETEIQRQLQRLAALRAIDQAITASLDLGLTLNVFLDHVTTQLAVDAADIMLLDRGDQMLYYGAGRGFQTRGFQRERLRLGEGRAGRAILERQIITTNGQGEHPASKRTGRLEPENFVAYVAVPLIAKGQPLGALELFHRNTLAPDAEWLSFLEALAGQAAIAIDNAQLFNGLQRANTDLKLAYDATIEGWSRALDLRDRETEGHSQRVTDLTLALAGAMGFDDAALVHVRRGALLHDIGKMGVPDGILLKPGPLNDDEWAQMRRHPSFAYEMLAPIHYLQPALDIPYCHHERWDGTGYPRGLKGEQIPLAARIFAIVDVWDALRSDRPYRQAWPTEKVRAYIGAQAGTHFDPTAVQAFLSLEL
jgi:putative nucleotidyltransferase with HDIG domain